MRSKQTIILSFLLAASIAANFFFAAQLAGVGDLETEVGTLKTSNARLGVENANAAATINSLLAEAARWEAYVNDLESLILP